MAGISAKAAGKMENRKKYNGIEFENDLDLNTYDAYYRELDPQTGRWWQIDPKIENMEAWSPYASNFDNPIRFSDPMGNEPDNDPPGKKRQGTMSSFWRGVSRSYSDAFNSGKALLNGKNIISTVKYIGSMYSGTAAGKIKLAAVGGAAVMATTNATSWVMNAPNMSKQEMANAAGYSVGLLTQGAILDGALNTLKTESVAPSSTTLYRAVTDGELADIPRNGLRTLGNGSYETGKLFATSAQDASNFGRINFALDQQPFTIIEAKAPNSVMQKVTSFQADGMKAVSVSANQLQKVNWVTLHNCIPIPNLNIFYNQ